jgi:hypothetical protein
MIPAPSKGTISAIKAHSNGSTCLSKGQGTTKQSVRVLRIEVGHIKMEIDFVTDCIDTPTLGQ